MPVKWTIERDQLLLLKILETHDLKLDPKKVVAAWPSGEEKPTPRAITERLVRIRANIKGSDKMGTDGSKLTIATGQGQKSVTSTPSKQLKLFSISTPDSAKRKRTGNEVKREMDLDVDSDADGEEDDGPATPLKKGRARGPLDIPVFSGAKRPSVVSYNQRNTDVVAGSSLGLTPNSANDGADFDADSPRERRLNRERRATIQYDMVSYGDDLDDEESSSGRADDGETSASDYVDEGAGHDDEDFA
ncbi:hypothetical protein BDV06DRAFT_220840 [Aspergillus oleicola]